MTTSIRPRCIEKIAINTRRGIYARCHRIPGHKGPCHAAGITWHAYGEQGQRVRHEAPCFADCIPLPGPPLPPRPKSTPRRKPRTARRTRKGSRR